MNDNLLEFVNESDVPETYKPILNLIGIENFMKLCKYAMGDEIYFPMQESILRNTRKRLIIQDYTGDHVSDLSRKYNLTQTRIRGIVKRLK